MSEKLCKRTTIGGQALIEGILMRGPKQSSIVVRKSDGELVNKVESVGSMSHPAWCRWPFIRGVVNFWDSMKYGMGALTYSAEFFETEEDETPGKIEQWLIDRFGEKTMEKAAISVALVLGILLPILLFILLPTLVAGLFGDGLHSILRNLIEGAIRILVFLAFLWLTSKEKDVARTYMYHGAEHKTIACYEAGEELTVENCRKHSRFHPRCGTSFLFVVMIVSILFYSLFTWTNPLVRVCIRLLFLPVIVGISYEFNRFVGRHDNWLTNALRAPGLMLQRFTTKEPDDGMLEVAILALESVIPENDKEDRW